ncbi:hypothetical protein IMG5_001130 [Ichthyophthirius multifiliis]|uniref:Protein kinase domain-containing protein n=1 Tax=Ichthyophthirius multifiliis TaxID=5932 RepID=G0QIQ4_ICHMU|nr:hypothetical protein IMG5_001130 [Ichthyophthirius multifiliis]EGR34884.1 hypothetical protein IMG5_001130 [Ichthyophthirius multifiliis]|eukprot:XP_004040188.1 hypothetical protein IMG5_001130 [Ichthyophthirius multifiliis]
METPTILRSENKKIEYIGRFKVLQVLGSGSFGTVYKVVTYKGLEFALKQIHNKKLKKLMLAEINALKSVQSKYIVGYHEYFYDKQNIPCIVMELCEGGTLNDYMKKFPYNCIPEKQAMMIFVKILIGMKAIQRAKLIHRDIKLQNIMMDKYNQPKIGDFGLATHTDKKQEQNAGTPIYMAPEILMGATYDQQVDIWSLGVLLFIMLFNDFPFAENNDYSQLQKINKLCEPCFSFNSLKKTKYQNIQKQLEDIFEQIFVINPEKRIRLEQLIEMEFVKKYDVNNELCEKEEQQKQDTQQKQKIFKTLESYQLESPSNKLMFQRVSNSQISNENNNKKKQKDNNIYEIHLLPYNQFLNRANLLIDLYQILQNKEEFISWLNFNEYQLQIVQYYIASAIFFSFQALNKILDERENINGFENWSSFVFSKSYLSLFGQVQIGQEIWFEKVDFHYQEYSKITSQTEFKIMNDININIDKNCNEIPGITDVKQGVVPPQQIIVPQEFSLCEPKLTKGLKIYLRAVLLTVYSKLQASSNQKQSSVSSMSSFNNIRENNQISISNIQQQQNKTIKNELNMSRNNFNRKNSPTKNINNNNNLSNSVFINNLQQLQQQSSKQNTNNLYQKSKEKNNYNEQLNQIENQINLKKQRYSFKFLLCSVVSHIISLKTSCVELDEFKKYLQTNKYNEEEKIFNIFLKWLDEIQQDSIKNQIQIIFNKYLPKIDQNNMEFF